MVSKRDPLVGAVVLAAGMSRRMGKPKLVLPWGDTTVIGQVVRVLQQAGVLEIVVVTGGDRIRVEEALAGLPVKLVQNEQYREDHMLLSLQTGIRHLSECVEAVFVVLGDQPQIQPDVITALLCHYVVNHPKLLAPSFQNRRGHPWLVDQKIWPDLLKQLPPTTLRQWLHNWTDEMDYLLVQSDTIFRDLDTPGDYLRERP